MGHLCKYELWIDWLMNYLEGFYMFQSMLKNNMDWNQNFKVCLKYVWITFGYFQWIETKIVFHQHLTTQHSYQLPSPSSKIWSMKIKNPRLILLNKLHNYHLFFWFNLLPQWRPDRCVPSADKLTWFKVSAAAALQTLLQVNTEYRARQLVPPPSSRNHFNLVVCAMWIRLLSDQLVLLTWENFLQVWTSWAMVRVVHGF